jgi:hypothetical protein
MAIYCLGKISMWAKCGEVYQLPGFGVLDMFTQSVFCGDLLEIP